MALVNYTNEYERLKTVALYRPRTDEIHQGKPEEVMYLSKPDPAKVLHEFDSVVSKFKSLGIEVIVLEERDKAFPSTPNMIFLRDVAAAVNDKVVLANMKFDIRKGEPEKFESLMQNQVPGYNKHFVKLSPHTTMEGADILVSDSGTIFGYTGFRTSPSAVSEICSVLGLKLLTIQANIDNIPQHLLGGMHIIASGLIARRPRYCTVDIAGFKYIDLDETEETREGFAMNIVTLSPMEILMPSGCQKTQKVFEKHGVKCHLINISEIHKMGGGLACMTLPLERRQI